MRHGDVTTGSAGPGARGRVVEEGEVSHYMREFEPQHVPLRTRAAKNVLNIINKNFDSLAFCPRWIDRLGEEKYLMGLNQLCKAGLVTPCVTILDCRTLNLSSSRCLYSQKFKFIVCTVLIVVVAKIAHKAFLSSPSLALALTKQALLCTSFCLHLQVPTAL